jgi:hypothetical protein
MSDNVMSLFTMVGVMSLLLIQNFAYAEKGMSRYTTN